MFVLRRERNDIERCIELSESSELSLQVQVIVVVVAETGGSSDRDDEDVMLAVVDSAVGCPGGRRRTSGPVHERDRNETTAWYVMNLIRYVT